MSHAFYREYFDAWAESFDFIFYSILTIIHRAEALDHSLATEISPKCHEYAKTSLKVHLKCFNTVKGAAVIQQVDYVNW